MRPPYTFIYNANWELQDRIERQLEQQDLDDTTYQQLRSTLQECQLGTTQTNGQTRMARLSSLLSATRAELTSYITR